MSKHLNRRIVSGISSVPGLALGAVISTSPIIQIYSDKEIIIECAKNIEYYDEKRVRIYSGKISVTVLGNNLEIKCLADRNLSVSGYITGIEFQHN